MPRSSLHLRNTKTTDLAAIHQLYLKVAQQGNGIIRFAHEITEDYVQQFIAKSLSNGIGLVMCTSEGQIVGEIHTYVPGLFAFRHMLADITIIVDPDFQGQGIGRKLFSNLINWVKNGRPDILKIELFVRQHNTKTIAFYESLGFQTEGVLKDHIFMPDQTLETPIQMAWRNPQFNPQAQVLNAKGGLVILSPIRQKDIESLSKLANTIYPQHFSYLWEDEGESYRERSFSVQQLHKELDNTSSQWYLAHFQGQAVGFLKISDQQSWEGSSKDHFKLDRIYLLASVKGQGIGQALLDFTIQQAQSQGRSLLWLEVMDSSTGPLAFYKKNGFTIFGEHQLELPGVREGLRGMYKMKKTWI